MALIYGNRFDNVLIGTTIDDVLAGLGGNDSLDGGSFAFWRNNDQFVDTAWFSGALSGYRFSGDGAQLVVQDINAIDGSDGTDRLTGFERLTFAGGQLTVTGAEQQVGGALGGNQTAPAITSLHDGGFMLFWTGPGLPGFQTEVFAQRFFAAGSSAAPAFRVNTDPAEFQDSVAATTLRDGTGVLAVWRSAGPGFSDILVQRYDTAGNPAEGPFAVSTSASIALANAPAITSLANDGALAAWTSTGEDGAGDGIMGRVLSAGGFGSGSPFVLNTTTAGNQSDPAAAQSGSGAALVVWTGTDADGEGVYGRRFDGDGVALGNDFLVNQTTLNAQNQPAVAALEGGGYVVAWLSFGGGGFGNVYARQFNANGSAAGGEFLVNVDTTFNGQLFPNVAALADGGFLVSWADFDNLFPNDAAVVGQRYDAAGDAMGGAFRLSGTVPGDQILPVVAGLAGGGFTAAWQSPQLGDADIFTRLFDAGGNGTLQVTGTASGDLLNLGGAQTLHVDGAVGNDTILGGAAADFLAGGAGNDSLVGGDADDNLAGGAGADTLSGDAGGDFLDGGIGADRLVGGTGDDEYVVDNAGDVIVEVATGGNDTVRASINFTLGATLENLLLVGDSDLNGTGNAGGNLIVGNDGDNRLDGGAGADLLSGGRGDDTYVVDNELDAVGESVGNGVDTVVSSVTLALPGDVENLTLAGATAINGTGNNQGNNLVGNAGANNLSGAFGNDALVGGAGNDTLSGGGDNDILRGGLGADQLTGGDGADQFVFDGALSTITNVDLVTDFAQGVDELQLSKSVFGALGTAGTDLDALQFRAGAGFTSGATTAHRVIYDTDTGSLFYDRDGSGAAASVKFAVLNDAPSIGVGDIFVTN